jgi:hypothetical protein
MRSTRSSSAQQLAFVYHAVGTRQCFCMVWLVWFVWFCRPVLTKALRSLCKAAEYYLQVSESSNKRQCRDIGRVTCLADECMVSWA